MRKLSLLILFFLFLSPIASALNPTENMLYPGESCHIDQFWASNMTYQNTNLGTAWSSNNIYALWADDFSDNVYVATLSMGRIYAINQTDMTLNITGAELDAGKHMLAVCSDANYVYCGGESGNIHQLYKTNLSKYTASAATGGGQLRAVAENGSYVYIGGEGDDKVHGYWKNNLTALATSAALLADVRSIVADSDYVYSSTSFGMAENSTHLFASTGTIYKQYYNNLTEVTHNTVSAAANSVGIFRKSDLGLIGNTTSYGTTIRGVVTDYRHVYAVGDTNYIKQYNQSDLTLNYTSGTTGGSSYGLGIRRLNDVPGGAPPNTPPSISCANPANASTGISLSPVTSVCTNDTDGNALTVCFLENSTGSWVIRQVNSTAANSTVYWVDTYASVGSTKYYWNVTAYDGTANTTSALFEFTTAAIPTWKPLGNYTNTTIELSEYYYGISERSQSSSVDAQTFTIGSVGPQNSFIVTNITCLVGRNGDPGNHRIAIQKCNSTGYPDGVNISVSNVLNANLFESITSGDPHTWWNYTFSSPPTLKYETQYAIVSWPSSANGTGYVCWWFGGGYPEGTALRSDNPDTNVGPWTNYPIYDRSFLIYGYATSTSNWSGAFYNASVWSAITWNGTLFNISSWHGNNLYEWFNPTQNTNGAINKTGWRSQSFTIGTVGENVNFVLSNVYVRVIKTVTNDNLFFIRLYASDVNHKPTGAILSSGIFNVKHLPVHATAINHMNVSMSAYNMVAGTRYVLVHGGFDDPAIRLAICSNATVPNSATYLGGFSSVSADSGVTYTSSGTQDNIFEVWGSSTAQESKVWGGALKNATYWGNFTWWNGTLYGVSAWHNISWWNGSLWNWTKHRLFITIEGSGYVEINPDQVWYDVGDIVNITAVPFVLCDFDHWAGDLAGNINPNTVAMIPEVDKYVTVNFSGSTFTWTDNDTDIPDLTDIVNPDTGMFYWARIFTYAWTWALGGWFIALFLGVIGGGLYVKYNRPEIAVAYFVLILILYAAVTSNIVYVVAVLIALVIGSLLHRLITRRKDVQT